MKSMIKSNKKPTLLKWNKAYKLAVVLFVGMFFSLSVFAQADAGDGDSQVPIDGGLTLLLAAGAGLGVKKIYDQRKKQKDEKAG